MQIMEGRQKLVRIVMLLKHCQMKKPPSLQKVLLVQKRCKVNQGDLLKNQSVCHPFTSSSYAPRSVHAETTGPRRSLQRSPHQWHTDTPEKQLAPKARESPQGQMSATVKHISTGDTKREHSLSSTQQVELTLTEQIMGALDDKETW
ncbi:hypothetical protein E2320_018201, partial [Naja naja]